MINEKLLGFKENNYEMKLKYDGERFRNKYTVLLIPLLERSNLKCCDTDSFAEVLDEFIEEASIDVSTETRSNFVNIFRKLTEMVIEKYDENVVFNFSISNSDGLKYYVYISQSGDTKHFTDESFEEVLKFLELRDLWN